MAKSVSVIRAEEYRDFLCLMSADIEKMSDFEALAFACENISFTVGSRFRKDFLSALSEDMHMRLSIEDLKNREVQKTVWRVINGDYKVHNDIAKTHISEDFSQLFNVSYIATPVLLNAFLENRTELPDTLGLLIEKIAEHGEIAVDMSDFQYSRPDEYHTNRTYQRLLSGEVCQTCEMSALLCWIICRVLMRKNTRLYILVNDSLKETEKLLRLLEERKLYPKISVCFAADDKSIFDTVAELCLRAKEKNISSEIIVPEEMEEKFIYETVKQLIWNIPVSCVDVCSFKSSVLARKRFYDALKKLTEEAGGM